jgi:NADPH-dependent 2,4-dienoyl-CoA reductase/sulfur reductase-like enzyme
MSDACQLLVIGAGPAGLAAAGTAASHGLNVTLLDEQPAAGGQIYRRVDEVPESRRALMGNDYASGVSLLKALDEPGVTHIPGASVWQAEGNRSVCYSVAGKARRVEADHIIIATGAMERPMPFPGWTTPGVMGAGAAQVLMKSAGVVPDGNVILAGSGPLLYLLAWQYLRCGVTIDAIVETVPPENHRRAMVHAIPALGGWDYLLKGARMLSAISQARIPRFHRASALRAQGTEQLEQLSFTSGGRRHTLPCDLLAVHQGVVPNVQLSRALDLEHMFDNAQRCWRPVVDEWGATRLEGISIAGDGAGIGGAAVAAAAGQIAGLDAARRLGVIDPGHVKRLAKDARALITRNGRIRPFLDALYAPDPQFLSPSDETIICRCEEVRAGDVRHFVSLGCLGPNQTKSFGRPGMGPCQGRLCGLTVSEVIAAEREVPVADVGYYRIRPPIKPVTLGEVASLDENEGLGEAGRVI